MASAGIAKHWLPYDAYYKYQNLNRLMRYLAMTLGLLESYRRVGDGFRFDAFEPVRPSHSFSFSLSIIQVTTHELLHPNEPNQTTC